MGKVAVVIPTYNGGNDIYRLLNSLQDQNEGFDVLIVDSSSNDGTDKLIRSHPIVNKIITVEASNFNHGGTRQLMVDNFSDYDFYVFLTQDAYLSDQNAIKIMVDFFKDSSVGAVCGRQLPHINANPIASHARVFNYPTKSNIRSFSDISTFGLKVPFISNSFSAYRKTALLEVGGFPSDVILGEDMYVAARMVLAGWKIGYAAEAKVYHSHNYSFVEEWRRYFDTGVFHARQSWLREEFGSISGEGLRFVKSELCYLKNKKYLWPESIVRNLGKLVAYKLGQAERYLPLWIKKNLSMHRSYWK